MGNMQSTSRLNFGPWQLEIDIIITLSDKFSEHKYLLMWQMLATALRELLRPIKREKRRKMIQLSIVYQLAYKVRSLLG